MLLCKLSLIISCYDRFFEKTCLNVWEYDSLDVTELFNHSVRCNKLIEKRVLLPAFVDTVTNFGVHRNGIYVALITCQVLKILHLGIIQISLEKIQRYAFVNR